MSHSVMLLFVSFTGQKCPPKRLCMCFFHLVDNTYNMLFFWAGYVQPPQIKSWKKNNILSVCRF